MITILVLTIIKLKSDYSLQDYKNPIQMLNQRCPDWKSQFPLLMEDASIEKMLGGFVEAASRSTTGRVKGKIPSVERILDLENSNKLSLVLSFQNLMLKPHIFLNILG